MSSSLPVPSKGVLRALRQLALGTSCTVAFGVGIITEDRRRRIHTVKEAHRNGRRIKQSRKYHSNGVVNLATLEQQLESSEYWKGKDAYADNGENHTPFWRPRQKESSSSQVEGGIPTQSEPFRTTSSTESNSAASREDNAAPTIRPIALNQSQATFIQEENRAIIPRMAKLSDEMAIRKSRIPQISVSISAVACKELLFNDKRNGNHREAIKNYLRIFTRTTPDQGSFQEATAIALKCALAIGGTQDAETMIAAAMNMAEKFKFSILTRWLTWILRSQWRQCKAFSSVQELFDRLQPSMNTIKNQQKLLQSYITIAFEAGEDDIAMAQVDSLLKDSQKLDVKTLGSLALWKAKKNDWEAVTKCYKSMHREGYSKNMVEYVDSFIPIIQQYSKTHSLSSVEKFLQSYVNDFGIRPNEALSHAMVAIYAKEGEILSVARWIEFGRPLGFVVNHKVFNRMLEMIRTVWHPPIDKLYLLCLRIARMDESLVSPKTASILRFALKTEKVFSAKSVEAWLDHIDQLVPSLSRDTQRNLSIRMSDALMTSEPEETLQLYSTAREAGFVVSGECIALAVQAEIQSSKDNGVSRAVDIVRDAKNNNLDIEPAMTSLLMDQLNNSSHDVSEVETIVTKTLAILRQQGLHFPLPAALKAAHILINKGKVRDGLALYNTIWDSRSDRGAKLNLAALSVLFRAYFMLYDANGMKWAIQKMQSNGIMPDSKFRLFLKNSRRELRRVVERSPYDMREQKRLDVLEECYKMMLMMRQEGRVNYKEAENKALEIMWRAAEDRRKVLREEPKRAQMMMNPIRMQLKVLREGRGASNVDGASSTHEAVRKRRKSQRDEELTSKEGLGASTGVQSDSIEEYGALGERQKALREDYEASVEDQGDLLEGHEISLEDRGILRGNIKASAVDSTYWGKQKPLEQRI